MATMQPKETHRQIKLIRLVDQQFNSRMLKIMFNL